MGNVDSIGSTPRGTGGPGTGASKLSERFFFQKVRLGQGSFGTVWRAVDRSTNLLVAIKQLDKACMKRRGFTADVVEREVVMMRACEHKNVTRVLGTFEDDTSIYMAQEYCNGGDFGDKLRERSLSISEAEAAMWMHQALSALDTLHAKSICHRDIKPDNFMIQETRSAGAVDFSLKLTDFGLAVYLPPAKLLTEKCGTPAFMAPEVHLLKRGSNGYGLVADMWAAGVIMYQVMHGGEHPFLSKTSAGTRFEEDNLLKGHLEFNLQGQTGQNVCGERKGGLRFSDDAERLCRSMVEVDGRRRLAARDAVNDSWFRRDRHVPSLNLKAVGAQQVQPLDVSQAELARRYAEAAPDAKKAVQESISTMSTLASVTASQPPPPPAPPRGGTRQPYTQPAPPRAFSEDAMFTDAWSRSKGRLPSGEGPPPLWARAATMQGSDGRPHSIDYDGQLQHHPLHDLRSLGASHQQRSRGGTGYAVTRM